MTEEKLSFYQELAQDPEKVREYGVRQFTQEETPFEEFGVKSSAKRIITDAEAGTGYFAPQWKQLLRRLLGIQSRPLPPT